MALINEENKYIKMMSYGGFSIYPDEETRLKEKAAPSIEIIEEKYTNEITGYNNWFIFYLNQYLSDHGITQEEFDNMTPVERQEIIDATINEFPATEEILTNLASWRKEYCNYRNDVALGLGAQHSYPLMEEYYSNVGDSVPDIIEGGQIPMDVSDVSEVYEIVKENKNFGETKDA